LFLQDFRESMPHAYRERFRADQIAAHAAVSASRGSASARVGAFPWHELGPAALCVVANDRAGLLATISAALVLAELDVVDAVAYTRRTAEVREAVDLFWVRSKTSGVAIDPPRIERLNQLLNDLIDGHITESDLVTPRDAEGTEGGATTVRFLEGESGEVTTLEVETTDRSGLLLALSRALFTAGVQIVGSEVRTRGQLVSDRFEITELDGSPISESRRLAIQVAVLGAVGPVLASSAPRPSA
jgi:[protein-PII] uridylyltransferase